MKRRTLDLLGIVALIMLAASAAKAQTDNSPECVRARPARILNRKVYPNAAFKLTKNKEYPFEYIGFETVKLKNGDELTIKNYGCENYSLDFRFEISRFKGSPRRVRYWYQTAAQLMDSVLSNLIKDEFLPRIGTKALKEHIRKHKTLRFDDEIVFDDSEIEEAVSVPAVRKSKDGKNIVEISFGIGPL